MSPTEDVRSEIVEIIFLKTLKAFEHTSSRCKTWHQSLQEVPAVWQQLHEYKSWGISKATPGINVFRDGGQVPSELQKTENGGRQSRSWPRHSFDSCIRTGPPETTSL